jgi:hypothetical protein
LRSLQEIQPDFVEEAKAYAGLWSQGKQKIRRKKNPNQLKVLLTHTEYFFVLLIDIQDISRLC